MNNKSNMIAGKLIPAIISVILLTAFDQFTKYLITLKLELDDSIPIIPNVLEIHYIRNAGMAWGMLQNKQIVFYICTVVFLIIASIFYFRLANKNHFPEMRVLTILVMSGAIGNFIDRIRFQYVIDFIYFKLINFPIFNIADCYVTIGVFVTIFLFVFKYKEEDFDKMLK